MKLNLRKYKGFTLVELLLVVGIIALGSVVAYITLPKVQSTSRANAEAVNINTISAGLKTMYANSKNYTSLGNDTTGTTLTIQGKVAPQQMIDAAGTGLVNGFGGVVTVSSGPAIGSLPIGTTYLITYNSVPNAECNKLVINAGRNFLRVTVNGGLVKSAPGEAPMYDLEPDRIAIIGCNSNSDSNIIRFQGN